MRIGLEGIQSAGKPLRAGFYFYFIFFEKKN